MERQRPPYLIKRKGWKGQTVWYYWKRPKPQIRLIGEYGTREFWESYERASLGSLAIVRKRQISDKPKASLAWLIERYRETGDWSDKSAATRRQRENIFRRITDANPDLAYEDVDRALIVQTRDAKKDTPSEANNFLDALRGLFKWAVDAGFVENNPVAGIKNLKRPKTGGFKQWSEQEITAFRNHWPVGTRERLALEIFVNTGLRRGDASRLGRQHLRNGHVRIVTEKTKTEIEYPVPNEFLKVVDNSPTGDMTLIVSKKTGLPLSKEGLGTWFHKAAKAAGVDGNCHGLRKAAATRLAEAGATIPELNAVFGWSGTSMASLYTEKASRKILAANAAAKLGG